MTSEQQRRSVRRERIRRLVYVVAAVSAVVAALSPARPVDLRPADAFWCGLLGLAGPLMASRARRWAVLWAGGIAAVVGVGGDAVGIASTVALVVLLGLIAFSDRRDRLTAALVGAFAVQALLRGPSYGPLGLPTIVGAVALLPLAVSAFQMARSKERKVARWVLGAVTLVVVVGSALAGVAALESRSKLETGADRAVQGLDLIRDGDTPAAAQTFDQASADFADASSGLNGLLTSVGRVVPVVGQHVEALRRVSTAGEQLSTSAAVTASTADYRDLKADGGRIDLTRVISLQDPVAESAATITTALADVAAVRSPWLLDMITTELDDFDTKLSDAREQTQLAADALAIAPALLGADGPKRYFMAFSTPGESRDGGGFLGAWGLLAADGGRLDLVQSGTSTDMNRPLDLRQGLDDGYSFVPPPDWDLRYGAYLVGYFTGNMGASPDWPTDGDVIGQIFPQTPVGQPIDGVIYADPAALAGLLSLTGPIEVEGIDKPLDAGNAEEYLLYEQYVAFEDDNQERKDLLGDVAEATFDALTSRPLPGLTTLTDVLGPLVSAGHLRMAVFEDEPAAFLDQIGLSGRWSVEPGADHLSVRSSNLLANKIDWFLHRDIDVATQADPVTGVVRTRLTITLRNDAPDSGLPPYLIGNQFDLPLGTNRHLLTVHSPHRLESATLDGQTVGVQTQSEFGGPVYSVRADLAPGQTRTVVMELQGGAPAWPYALQLIPQATANPDAVSVTITRPDQAEPAAQLSGPLTETKILQTTIGGADVQ
jgi:hypothetical protein